MEPNFEIRFTGTHKMMAETIRYIIRKMMNIALAVLGFMLVGYARMSLIGEPDMPALISIVLMAGVLYFFPDYMAWKLARQEKKKNNGRLLETVVLVGDTIEMSEGGKKLTICYDQIEKVVHLKHSYCLMMDKQTLMPLDPNGFTKGSFAQFKQFLREKRPDLTIPE